MAKILPFAGAHVERRSGERKREGEIVIFPGVRVEYDDRPPEPRSKRRRRGPGDDALSA